MFKTEKVLLIIFFPIISCPEKKKDDIEKGKKPNKPTTVTFKAQQ